MASVLHDVSAMEAKYHAVQEQLNIVEQNHRAHKLAVWVYDVASHRVHTMPALQGDSLYGRIIVVSFPRV